ncbi:PhnE/PtxC family ABC transporter permease [Thalassobacillus devorans]|uniref:PhnE/PtxC family ABC transporter permease n=1 Tax=Thalassobacillus devorans TaxID=279813 RepID=UPI00048DDC56|nr:ABC transporter permease subunit [Thalassobacillus devorans]
MQHKLMYFHSKTILTIVMLLTFIASLFSVEWGGELVHAGGWTTMLQMIQGMLQPDFSLEILKLAFMSAWITLAYAVAGMTLAVLFGFVFGVLSSGILLKNRGASHYAVKNFFRGMLGFLRAIHELVWALLFVAATGISPFAAIFAIAIPYSGILGRVFSDIFTNVPEKPLQSLRANGATRLQQLLYGYLPFAAPDLISYAFYRFECAIRSSAIMSFIGLGGLGFQIQLSMQDLHYDEVWTFLIFLIGMVMIVDLWSQMLRKRLVA